MRRIARHERRVNAEEAQFRINLPMQLCIERARQSVRTDPMSLAEIAFTVDEVIEIGTTLDVRVFLPQPGCGHCGAIVSKRKVTRSWSLSQRSKQILFVVALCAQRLLRMDSGNGRSESYRCRGIGRSRALLRNPWRSSAEPERLLPEYRQAA